MASDASFWFPALAWAGASAATCGGLLFGAWRQWRLLRARATALPANTESPTPAFIPGRTPFAGTMLDVATEAQAVLEQMSGQAAANLVRLHMAVPAGIALHTDRQALRAVLGGLVDHAMRHAAGSALLLCAVRHGGRVQITLTSDGPGPPASVQEAALRDVAGIVALQGGTVEVQAHRDEGTTVVVRLPEPAGSGLMLQPAAPANNAAPMTPERCVRDIVQAVGARIDSSANGVQA